LDEFRKMRMCEHPDIPDVRSFLFIEGVGKVGISEALPAIHW
jgi:hypothetical protein